MELGRGRSPGPSALAVCLDGRRVWVVNFDCVRAWARIKADRVAQSVEQRTSTARPHSLRKGSLAREEHKNRAMERRSLLGRPESPHTTTWPVTASVSVRKAGGLGNQQAREVADRHHRPQRLDAARLRWRRESPDLNAGHRFSRPVPGGR